MSEIEGHAATSPSETNVPSENNAAAQGADAKSPAPSPHRTTFGGVFDETSPKKASPTKPQNGGKLPQGMDLNSSSLAAISARLMPQLTPAELEIVRINRDAAAAAKAGRLARQGDGVIAGGGSNSGDDSPSDQGGSGSSPVNAALTAAIRSGGSALHDSMIAEEWVNVHLETSGAYLLPASEIQTLLQRPDMRGGGGDDSMEDEEEAFAFRRKGDSGPLGRAGIDRWTLYRLGMPKDLVDRLYRALYVYTNGFHNIINEIASHCPPSVEKHVSSNVWLTFLLLLEQCENGKYEMAMLKFKQATQEWRQQMQEEFMNDKLQMEAHAQTLDAQFQDELARSAHKSEVIAKLASEACQATATIAEMQHTLADLTEQHRVCKLEIMVHEDVEKNLNAQIDEARKDFEVANSERFNALTERYALDEEIRKLQRELERLEAEKSNYAKRMHETLFMNQALRATNESLKQNAVVLNMDKEKLDKEKQTGLDKIDTLESDLHDIKILKAAVEHDLVESTRRQAHLEERLRAMKEQLDAEMESTARCVTENASLSSLIDEEKVKVGVLEAKCNLLTAEKQNTGMRAQDKLRIERLLNQKLELENQIELLKLERTRDQEQIWNLRASLEALDSELQQTKRVFSAGQQAFLHSERSAEQLRHQLQEVEKNYEKSSKNLTSLRERFKMFEESSKEQVTKLEVELKVTSAQLREVTYVNRDNAAVIADLTKALEVAEKETKSLRNRLEASEKQYEQLLSEKEDLQRDQKQRDKQHSSSKQVIAKFIRDLQNILALVKLDEYPLDEALREVLRMVKDTFGQELDISKVLDDEDEPLDFEEEYDEQELVEAEQERMSRLSARRTGFSVSINPAGPSEEDECSDGSGSICLPAGAFGEMDADGKRRLTKVSRMSKFRRSKLDTQVKKLQREVENKTDLVRSLEDVVCSQADEIATLTATTDQQLRWLKLNENQKGMLLTDIEGYMVALASCRVLQKKTETALQEAKIDLVMETNKTFQMELLLQSLRRQYDMQCATSEDLTSKIWRAYEYDLLMKSLRRDEAIQATVCMADAFSQTLVPQRNPVLERVRVPAMNLPAMNPAASHAESLIQQINDTARALLPNVSATAELALQPSSLSRATLPPYSHTPQPSVMGAYQRAQSPRQPASRRGRGRQRHMHRQLMAVERTAPPPTADAAPPQLMRHFNEFGMRQDVLISPVYPPYFPSHPPASMLKAKPVNSRVPRKPMTHRQQLSLNLHSGDARSDAAGWDARVQQRHVPFMPSVKYGGRQQQRYEIPPSELPQTTSRLRYHRGFLRTGMEVLRSGGDGPVEEEDDDDEYDDEYGDTFDEGYTNDEADGGDWVRSRASLHSASKLELAVRDFHDEQDANIATGRSPRRSPSKFYSHRLKDDESRGAVGLDGRDEDDDDDVDNDDDDRALAEETRNSRFVPGVLYPLLPPR